MKERFVDFALLIALGIIGLAIVFTLINLGRDRTPSGATAPAPTQTAQTDVSPTETEPAGVRGVSGCVTRRGDIRTNTIRDRRRGCEGPLTLPLTTAPDLPTKPPEPNPPKLLRL